MEVDWNKVAEAGAIKASEAIGAAVGGAIGSAIAKQIAGALLGNDDNSAFQEEVVKRLQIIEGKIDNLYKFTSQRLPKIIQKGVREEIIGDNLRELSSAWSDAQSAIAVASEKNRRREQLSAQQVQFLIDSASELKKCGDKILQCGKEFCLAGTHALTGIVACYIQLIKIDNAWGRSLQLITSRFEELLAPMLDPELSETVSYSTALLGASELYGQSKSVFDAIGRNQTYLLVAADYPDYGMVLGWWGKYSFDVDGVLAMEKGAQNAAIPGLTPPLSRLALPDRCPWIATRILGIDTPNPESGINDCFATTSEYVENFRSLPGLIEQMRIAKETIEKTIEVCQVFNSPETSQHLILDNA